MQHLSLCAFGDCTHHFGQGLEGAKRWAHPVLGQMVVGMMIIANFVCFFAFHRFCGFTFVVVLSFLWITWLGDTIVLTHSCHRFDWIHSVVELINKMDEFYRLHYFLGTCKPWMWWLKVGWVISSCNLSDSGLGSDRPFPDLFGCGAGTWTVQGLDSDFTSVVHSYPLVMLLFGPFQETANNCPLTSDCPRSWWIFFALTLLLAWIMAFQQGDKNFSATSHLSSMWAKNLMAYRYKKRGGWKRLWFHFSH